VKNILLDTNAYAAFKRGEPEAISVIQRAPVIGINSVVLGELYSGFAAGEREAENRQELKRLLDSPRVALLPITAGTAEYYARVYLDLRRKGKPIPTNDMWIAASALQHGLDVFSYDHHFTAVDGLVVGSSVKDFDIH